MKPWILGMRVYFSGHDEVRTGLLIGGDPSAADPKAVLKSDQGEVAQVEFSRLFHTEAEAWSKVASSALGTAAYYSGVATRAHAKLQPLLEAKQAA